MFISIESISNFPKMPGIYRFRNKLNGKIYIGEAINLKRRMSYYRSLNEKRPIIYAFEKYGFSQFEYSILELFPNGTPKSVLLDREEFWIRFYKATEQRRGYNVTHRGTCRINVKCSEQTKRKIGDANKGRKASIETREKLSEMRKGKKHWQYGKSGPETSFWGKKLSDSHKKALLDANVGVPKFYNRRKIHQTNPKTGEIIKTWDSLREAAIGFFKNQKCESLISRVVRGERKKYKGFGWIYAETPKTMTKREASEKFKL